MSKDTQHDSHYTGGYKEPPVRLTEFQLRERLAKVNFPEGDQYGGWTRHLDNYETNAIVSAIMAESTAPADPRGVRNGVQVVRELTEAVEQMTKTYAPPGWVRPTQEEKK